MKLNRKTSTRPSPTFRRATYLCLLAFLGLVVIGWFYSTRTIIGRLGSSTTEPSPFSSLLQQQLQQQHLQSQQSQSQQQQSSIPPRTEVFPINKYTGLPGVPGFKLKSQFMLLPPKPPPIPKTSTETVAYVISITDCQWFVRDAAAVLGQSIDDVQSQSKYPHVRYALVHVSASECVRDLKELGYQVLLRDLPFNVTQIGLPMYKKRIEEEGCCGSKEFMKLWTYSLTEHKLAIHLDMDMLLLQPLDALWDAMLDPRKGRILQTEPSSLYQARGEDIDFMFTRDYMRGSSLTNPNATNRHDITSKYAVQGGFFVVRPSESTFQTMVKTVLHGSYSITKGWNRDGYGGYPGAAQIPGFFSFMYRPVQGAGRAGAVELNRCVYNNMQDPKYVPTNTGKQLCTTLDKTCTNDCQTIPFDKVKIAHFTQCRKPWSCERYDTDMQLCNQFLRKWFETRLYMEESWNLTVPKGDKSTWFYSSSLGFCRKLERKKEKREMTGKTYKVNKGSYRRIVFPWEPQSRPLKINRQMNAASVG